MHLAHTTASSQVLLESLGPQHAHSLVLCARQLALNGEMAHWASDSYGEEAANRYIARAQSKRASARGEVFAVMSADCFIGCGALDDVDWIHGSASLWLWLAPDARGGGKGRAAWAALRHIAAVRGIARGECLLPASSTNGVAWLKAQGGTQEGLFRGRYLLQEGRVDGVLVSFALKP